MTIESPWLIAGARHQPATEAEDTLALDPVQELKAWQAEAIGWLPLAEGAYLHAGSPEDDQTVITVVGVPDAGMVGMNVLLLT